MPVTDWLAAHHPALVWDRGSDAVRLPRFLVRRGYSPKLIRKSF